MSSEVHDYVLDYKHNDCPNSWRISAPAADMDPTEARHTRSCRACKQRITPRLIEASGVEARASADNSGERERRQQAAGQSQNPVAGKRRRQRTRQPQDAFQNTLIPNTAELDQTERRRARQKPSNRSSSIIERSGLAADAGADVAAKPKEHQRNPDNGIIPAKLRGAARPHSGGPRAPPAASEAAMTTSPNYSAEMFPVPDFSRMQVFRFRCFSGHKTPGLAVAVAETLEEAIDRIVLRWNHNLWAHMHRNDRASALRRELEPVLGSKAPSPEAFVAALRECKGWSLADYEQYLGPLPEDSLGSWCPAISIRPAEYSQLIREELGKAPYAVYPLTDCALYMGGL